MQAQKKTALLSNAALQSDWRLNTDLYRPYTDLSGIYTARYGPYTDFMDFFRNFIPNLSFDAAPRRGRPHENKSFPGQKPLK